MTRCFEVLIGVRISGLPCKMDRRWLRVGKVKGSITGTGNELEKVEFQGSFVSDS